VIIEPQRQALIPGFPEVRNASMQAGALGCSISGAGPTMFAWAHRDQANAVRDAMKAEFDKRNIEVDDWIVRINDVGARVL
jgi:homoserine kinase